MYRQSITFLIISLLSNFLTAQDFCHWNCDDAREDCFSCDIVNDLDGTSHQAWNPNGSLDDMGELCNGIQADNTRWYGFLAGSNSISIQVVSNCPTTATLQIGLSSACWGKCLIAEGDCSSAVVNLDYNSLIPGFTYYIWVDDCSASACDFDIFIDDHEAYELDEIAAIGVYSPCHDECLTGDCGNTSFCDEVSEVEVCVGQTIEFIALHEGNSSTDLGAYDGSCSIYPPYLDATFKWRIASDDIDIRQLSSGRSGPLYTVPNVPNGTIIEVDLDAVEAYCSEVDRVAWMDLVVKSAEEMIYAYEVCTDDLINGWNIPAAEDDDWLGPDEVDLQDVITWNNGCISFQYDSTCGCDPIQTLCIDILPCTIDTTTSTNNIDNLVPDFPWLEDLLDLDNCAGTTVSLYSYGVFSYLFIEHPGEQGILYNSSGVRYCQDRVGFSCIANYNLSGPIETWTCGDSLDCICPTVIEPVCGVDGITYDNACLADCANIEIAYVGSCEIIIDEQIFLYYPWLSSLIDSEGCSGTSVTEYRNGNYTYVLVQHPGEFPILYNADGVRYCQDRQNFSCIDIYNLEGPISSWECGAVTPPPSSAAVFDNRPWLSDLIDVNDCEGVTITEYEKGSYIYIYIKTEGEYGVLYNGSGLKYCTSRPTLDCLEFYGLGSDEITDSWSCSDGIIIDPDLQARSIIPVKKSIIYPNPSTGTIHLTNCDKSTELEICDLNGHKVEFSTEHQADNQLLINISVSRGGLYLIRSMTNGRSEIHKIFIMN